MVYDGRRLCQEFRPAPETREVVCSKSQLRDYADIFKGPEPSRYAMASLNKHKYRAECCCQLVVRVFHGYRPGSGKPSEIWVAALFPLLLKSFRFNLLRPIECPLKK